MPRTLRPALAALPALLLPSLAFAHAGGQGAGLAAGFLHPLLGLDHLLAMIAVGIWAAMLGGRAVWLVPAGFLLTLVAGAALGMAGLALPGTELIIAASVVALGVAIAYDLRPATALGVAAAAGFALFHGQGHGAEVPVGANGLVYTLGFMAATGLLHGLGVALGLVGRREVGRTALRFAGASVAVVGVLLLVTL